MVVDRHHRSPLPTTRAVPAFRGPWKPVSVPLPPGRRHTSKCRDACNWAIATASFGSFRSAGDVLADIPTESWAYESPPAVEIASFLRPGTERLIMFHIVVSGRLWVDVDGGDRHWANAGDVVVLPYGDQHRVGGSQSAEFVPIETMIDPPPWESLPVLRYGGGGDRTIWCAATYIAKTACSTRGCTHSRQCSSLTQTCRRALGSGECRLRPGERHREPASRSDLDPTARTVACRSPASPPRHVPGGRPRLDQRPP